MNCLEAAFNNNVREGSDSSTPRGGKKNEDIFLKRPWASLEKSPDEEVHETWDRSGTFWSGTPLSI